MTDLAVDADELLLDRYLGEADFTQVEHKLVHASTGDTWRAIKVVDLSRVGDVMPLTRVLAWLREAPERFGRGRRRPRAEAIRFDDLSAADGWVKLDERAERELVLGAIGKFWKPRIEWRTVEAAAFRPFAEPGYAKLAIGLSIRPYGRSRTLVTYEARTVATDDRSRRRFRRYWSVIRLGAGVMMRGALELIRRDAEERAGARP